MSFRSAADGTAEVKVKISRKKLAKLDRAGPTRATVTVQLGGSSATKKVTLVRGRHQLPLTTTSARPPLKPPGTGGREVSQMVR